MQVFENKLKNKMNKQLLMFISLAVAGGFGFNHSAYANDQNSFIDDATLNLNLRNFYMNRDYQGDRVRDTAEAWTQSFIIGAKSGYTPGKIGLGVDILGLYSLKIRGADNQIGTELLPVKDNTIQADDFGRTAVAAKLKASNTELKAGEWSPSLPVLRSDDGRSLPQTFQGWQLTSSEYKNLNLYLGQFFQNSPRNTDNMDDMYINNNSTVSSDQFNFVGADYLFNQKNDQISLWYSQLNDIYQQSYIRYDKTIPLNDLKLQWGIAYLYGKEQGSAKVGSLDNKAMFSTVSLANKHQKITFAVQQMKGKDSFLRVNGASGSTLANDSFTSSYDNSNERSWQLRYDLNFSQWNLSGLNLMSRYIYGDGIENSQTQDGREHGWETEISYSVQTGWLKSLSIKLRHSELRKDWGNTNSFNDNRVILNYTIPLFN